MLRSLAQLYGTKLGASDGAIGHVKDFILRRTRHHGQKHGACLGALPNQNHKAIERTQYHGQTNSSHQP